MKADFCAGYPTILKLVLWCVAFVENHYVVEHLATSLPTSLATGGEPHGQIFIYDSAVLIVFCVCVCDSFLDTSCNITPGYMFHSVMFATYYACDPPCKNW